MNFGVRQPVPAGTQYQDAHLDFAFSESKGGKLTGKLAGERTQTLQVSTCPSTTTAPGAITGRLTGTHRGASMSLTASSVSDTEPTVTPCPGAGTPGIMPGPFSFPHTASVLTKLHRDADGYFRYRTTVTDYSGPYPFNTEYSILVAKLPH